MGKVYKAKHLTLDRIVCIKTLKPAVRIWGVETEGADCMAQSLAAGEVVCITGGHAVGGDGTGRPEHDAARGRERAGEQGPTPVGEHAGAPVDADGDGDAGHYRPESRRVEPLEPDEVEQVEELQEDRPLR